MAQAARRDLPKRKRLAPNARRRPRYIGAVRAALTRRAFGGNQLAVLPEAVGLSDAEMQAIAAEMNFSESTFVLPPADRQADAHVRIFTPVMELPFAGTRRSGLASYLALKVASAGWRCNLGSASSRSRPRQVTVGLAPPGWTSRCHGSGPVETDRAALAGLIGLEPADLATASPAEFGTAGVEYLDLPLGSLKAVRRAAPDGVAIRRFFAGSEHPAVYLFSTEAESADAAAHARMFSPMIGQGVGEDPATGGAAGPFGAYLVRHGLRPAGSLLVEQGYEMGRPSQIEVLVESSGDRLSRVRVGGGVVRLGEGHLEI